MAPVSIVATVLCFGAILILSFVKPESTANNAVEEAENNRKYTLGVMLSIACVFIFSIVVLTARHLQEVNVMLIMQSMNTICFVLIGTVMLVRWAITGQAPFAMIWTLKSAILLASAALANSVAQMIMLYVN